MGMGGDFEADHVEFQDADRDPSILGHPTFPHALVVFAGGTIGTLLRYLLLDAKQSPTASVDWWLLAINLSGSFLLGILVASLFRSPTKNVSSRLFLGSGVLGGWTTYSAIISSTILLGHVHYWGAAVLTVLLQMILPVAFAVFGLLAGQSLRGSVR